METNKMIWHHMMSSPSDLTNNNGQYSVPSEHHTHVNMTYTTVEYYSTDDVHIV